jgi:3-deoxy-manno-octulosonate cytidylyltransferase (CMP-KDO synthetase)
MTSISHETGTDRLAEVAERIDSEIIVNVQGDEPLIEPAMIDEAIRPLVDDQTIVMGTLKSRVRDLHDFLSPNVVKVITDCNGFALESGGCIPGGDNSGYAHRKMGHSDTFG